MTTIHPARLHIYLEYADHREYCGSIYASRKLWMAEDLAQQLFNASKERGEAIHNWAVEDDDHKVLSWRSW